MKFEKGALCRIKNGVSQSHGSLSWSSRGYRLQLQPGDLIILLESGDYDAYFHSQKNKAGIPTIIQLEYVEKVG